MRWIALLMRWRTEGPEAGAMQQAVASIALGFTPRVALLEEAVLLEVSSSLRLFGGLQRLRALLELRLQQFFALNLQPSSPPVSELNQPPAQVISAVGATSLIALARLRCLCSPGARVPRQAIDLPLSSLSAARPHADVLERVGCRSWGDLAALPRGGVARRFGAPLLAALDCARGALPETCDWLALPEQFNQRCELDALVTSGPALMAGAAALLLRLQAWLLGRQSAVLGVQLTWYLDPRRDTPPTGSLVVRTAKAAQDLQHLARLLDERLRQEKLAAPVHALRLESLDVQVLGDAAAATPSLLIEDRRLGASALELIERLSARLGPGSVQRWQAGADHRPEHMQKWVDAQAGSAPRGLQGAPKTIAAAAGNTRARDSKGLKGFKKALKTPPETAPHANALYPTWLLAQPLKLVSAAGSPLYQGPLVRLAGPQRLEACGWLADAGAAEQGATCPAIRDYFIYRSAKAGLLWIYRERQDSQDSRDWCDWYLHGVFA